MPLDVQLFELTAGGLQEPKADWTAAAENHVHKALEGILAQKKDTVVRYELPKDNPEKSRMHEQLMKLHEVVGQSNMIGTGVQTFHLRPFKFGSHPGFRFELSFLLEEGLEYEGFVVGAIKADKLCLICYSGTREYYYPKYKETAEQIIASIHMP